ncbi:MAG: hypothetical protein SPI49_02720 [Eubacteriales bacterium]|nr:hypothetical protein [Eubacteriales bacterium]
MKKNIIIKLFAVLFALVLPVSSFAVNLDDFITEQLKAGKEISLDVSIQTTPGLAMNEKGEDWLADLTKAISLKIKGNDQNGLVTLMLNGEPVLNAVSQLAENGDVFVSLQEINTVLKLGNNGVNAETRKQLNDIHNVKDLLKVNLDEFQKFEPTGDEKLDAAIQNIIKNTTVEDYDKEDERFDKAVKVVTQKFSQEDFVNIMQSKTVEKSIKEQANLNKDVKPEDIIAMYSSGALMVEGTAKYYIDAEGYITGLEMPYTVTVDLDKMPKSEDSEDLDKMPESEDSEEHETGIKKVEFTLNYYRKTADPVVNHSISANVSSEGKSLLNGEALIKVEENKSVESEGKLVASGEEEFTLDFKGTKNLAEDKNEGTYIFVLNQGKEDAKGLVLDATSQLKNNTITNEIGVSLKMANATLEKADSDMKVGTVTVVENFGEKADIPSIDTTKAIDVEKISEDEEAQNQLAEALQGLFMSIMDKLPESVLDMIAPPQPVEENLEENSVDGTEENIEETETEEPVKEN